MEWRRATIARITTKTVLALCLFLAATAGAFVAGSSSANAAPFDFLTNHQLYDHGADIRSLQEFFNTHGFLVAQSGPGSPGNETSFFGLATFQALKAFQAAHGLPSTGYFGPLTRGSYQLRRVQHQALRFRPRYQMQPRPFLQALYLPTRSSKARAARISPSCSSSSFSKGSSVPEMTPATLARSPPKRLRHFKRRTTSTP